MRFILAFLLFFLLLGQTVTYAQVPLEGTFTPNECFAYTSIKRHTDPSLLETGKIYQVSGLNREGGDYIDIEVDGRNKWVNKNCGQLTLANENPIPNTSSNDHNIEVISNDSTNNNNGIVAESCPSQGCADEYILAISWQPGFCQTHQDKPECRIQTSNSFDAVNFTLHGLWPDTVNSRRIEYCGVSRKDIKEDKDGEWEDLPAVSVDEQTATDLSQLMPGVRSNLERHEWTRHGTCDGRNEDTYFDISLGFLKEVNSSQLQELFAQNIGQTVTRSQIETAFENSFGQGSANSLDVICGRNGLVSELRLKMRRPLVGEKLSDVLIPGRGDPCNQVLIDAAGF